MDPVILYPCPRLPHQQASWLEDVGGRGEEEAVCSWASQSKQLTPLTQLYKTPLPILTPTIVADIAIRAYITSIYNQDTQQQEIFNNEMDLPIFFPWF